MNESDSGWSDMVDLGFTFVATNCDDDEDRITDSRLHPPMPTYVDIDANGDEQLGTWYRPYAGNLGLANAVFRVAAHQQQQGVSNVDIVIESGEYSLIYFDFDNLAPSPWMTLKARGGPVILSQP